MTPSTASIRILRWPWLLQSSSAFDTADAKISFTGTAMFACRTGTRLLPMGGASDLAVHSRSSDWELYELPQGYTDPSDSGIEIQCFLEGQLERSHLGYDGACSRFSSPDDGPVQESDQSVAVFDWWDAFDDLLDLGDDLDGGISWSAVEGWLGQQRDSSEPRRALIVEIAERFGPTIMQRATRLRRILLRQRDLVPVNAIQQLDETCLRWYIRQPGETLVEKAGNQQEIMSVVRRESFDTLENRVLKDFLIRCVRASKRYLRRFQREFPQSQRVLSINRFAYQCEQALAVPEFSNVSLPRPGAQPNYVLQSHPQYRDVWQWYQRLLRNQDSEEQVWNWQGRLWADVARLLTGASCHFHASTSGSSSLGPSAISPAPFRVNPDSTLGRRLRVAWAPGPFAVRRRDAPTRVLTLVDADEAHLHPDTKSLGELGAHFFLVSSELEKPRADRVLVVWCLNAAGSLTSLNLDEMASSCSEALRQIRASVHAQVDRELTVDGMILTSRRGSNNDVLRTFGDDSHDDSARVAVAALSTEPAKWDDAVLELASLVEPWL